MIQMQLFDDDKPTPVDRGAQQLVEIREYLHVWTEAERARRIKKPRAEAQGEVPEIRGEDGKTIAACQRITIKGASK